MCKIIILFCLLFNTSNTFAQAKDNRKSDVSPEKANELYFRKNVAPIFKSSCTCHQGMTDYTKVLPKAQKILEVIQHPHGKMSSHLNKDYFPIVEYWVKTITVVTN